MNMQHCNVNECREAALRIMYMNTVYIRDNSNQHIYNEKQPFSSF